MYAFAAGVQTAGRVVKGHHLQYPRIKRIPQPPLVKALAGSGVQVIFVPTANMMPFTHMRC